MTQHGVGQFNARTEKGGDRFTTFFFVVVIFVVIASFVVGQVLVPRDTLLKFVPADVVVYVHANGTEAARLSAAAGSSQEKLREAAIYAIERDGALAWTIITPTSVAMLTENDSSLEKDATVRAALAAVRHSSIIQVYAVASTLLRPMLGDAASETEPVVIGANVRARGFGSAIMAARDAAQRDKLGIRVSTTARPAASPLLPANASFSTFGSGLELSPFDILFPEKGGEYVFAQGMADAEAEIRQRLEHTPVAVSLSADANKAILLHLPEITVHESIQLIERYVSSAWPARRSFTLPDNQSSYEIMVDPERNRFKPNSDGFSMLAVIDGPHIALRGDDNGGTLILAGTDLIPEKSEFAVPYDGACPTPNGRPFIHMTNSNGFFNSIPLGDAISAYFTADSLLIQKNGDSLVLFCGYAT